MQRLCSDQGTPLTGCFQRNQSIDLQIKMHFLLIYATSLKNNFERVHFSVKFQVMGGGGEIMTRQFCEISKNTLFTEHL